jgi:hypothetical protein
MILFSTSDTPGAAQAAHWASAPSAQERTLPLRIILPPRVSTVIRRASSASRLLLRPFHLTANTNVFAQKENGADYAAPSIKLNDLGL